MATPSSPSVAPPRLAVTPTPGPWPCSDAGSPTPTHTPKRRHSAYVLRDMPPTASSLSERIASLQRANQSQNSLQIRTPPRAQSYSPVPPTSVPISPGLAPPSPGPDHGPLPRPQSAAARFETRPATPTSPVHGAGLSHSPGSLKDRIARFQASAASVPAPRVAWTSSPAEAYRPPPRARRFDIDPSARPLVPHITGGVVQPHATAWVSPLRASRTGVPSASSGPLWGAMLSPHSPSGSVPMLRGAGPDAFQELDRARTPSGSSSVANGSFSSAPGNESTPSVVISFENDASESPPADAPAGAALVPPPRGGAGRQSPSLSLRGSGGRQSPSPSIPSSPMTPSGEREYKEPKSPRVAAAEAEIAEARRRGTGVSAVQGHGMLRDLQERTGVQVDGTGRGGHDDGGMGLGLGISVPPPRRKATTGRVLSITQDQVPDHQLALDRARRRKDQRDRDREEMQAKRALTTGALVMKVSPPQPQPGLERQAPLVSSPMASPIAADPHPFFPVSPTSKCDGSLAGSQPKPESGSAPEHTTGFDTVPNSGAKDVPTASLSKAPAQASSQSPTPASALLSSPAPACPPRAQPITPSTPSFPSVPGPTSARAGIPDTSPPSRDEPAGPSSQGASLAAPSASGGQVRPLRQPSPHRIQRPPPGAVLSLVDMDASDDEYEPGWVQVVSRG